VHLKPATENKLLRNLISNIENCETVTELTKQISVLDAINWIYKSWIDTNALTVVKCFHDACFPSGNLGANDVTLNDDPDNDMPLISFEYLDKITCIENTTPQKRHMTKTGKNNVGKY
jgi:hypothetical protein